MMIPNECRHGRQKSICGECFPQESPTERHPGSSPGTGINLKFHLIEPESLCICGHQRKYHWLGNNVCVEHDSTDTTPCHCKGFEASNLTFSSMQRIKMLEYNKQRTIDYACLKLREFDWHGLADAAMDLRDIDAELKGLNFK